MPDEPPFISDEDRGQTDPPYSGVDDLLYDVWCVIANARGWTEDPEWHAAATRWRDRWHAYITWANHE